MSNSDTCVALLLLQLRARKLIPATVSIKTIEQLVQDAGFDGPHWLLAYEMERERLGGAIAASSPLDALKAAMLAAKVSFYRHDLPPYAAFVHPGGAPKWVVKSWMAARASASTTAASTPGGPAPSPATTAPPAVLAVQAAVAAIALPALSFADQVRALLAANEPTGPAAAEVGAPGASR